MKLKYLISVISFAALGCAKSDITFLPVGENNTELSQLADPSILQAKAWVESFLQKDSVSKKALIPEKLNWQQSRLLILDTAGRIPDLIKVPFADTLILSTDIPDANPEGRRYLMLQKFQNGKDKYFYFYADFHLLKDQNQTKITTLSERSLTSFSGFMIIRNRSNEPLYAEKFINGRMVARTKI